MTRPSRRLGAARFRSVRRNSSPLLNSQDEVESAAETMLARSRDAVQKTHTGIAELMLVDKLSTLPFPSCFEELISNDQS